MASSSLQDGDATGESGTSPCLSVLLCGGCRHAIAREEDILCERDPQAWKDHVYSYEIDLFENGRPTWAYSATNPSARRFDLLRVAVTPTPLATASTPDSPSVDVGGPVGQTRAALVQLTGPYSDEHSFFVGFEWCFAHCTVCGHFVGWGFASSARCAAERVAAVESASEGVSGVDAEDAGNVNHDCEDESAGEEEEEEAPQRLVPDFLGVIVTQCTGECAYPESSYREDLALAAHRGEVRVEVKQFQRQLAGYLNALPTTGLAQTLFLYYRHLAQSLFEDGTVSETPSVLELASRGQLPDTVRSERRQRRRRRRDDDNGDDGGDDDSSTDSIGRSARFSNLPQPFHHLLRLAQRLLGDNAVEAASSGTEDDEV